MKINTTSDYITFNCDNKYSRLRYSKADHKLNKTRKKQYLRYKKFLTFAKKFKVIKCFLWLKLLIDKKASKISNSHKYKNLCSCFDRQVSFIKDNENFTGNEVIPYAITVYDLLPKEYVDDFSKKYISFRENAIDKEFFLGLNTIKSIRENFSKMATQFSTISNHNVDNFIFNKQHLLQKYFKSFSLQARDISHSFLGVSYTLTLSDEMIGVFETLLKNDILREGHYIDNGSKKKKNYAYTIGGCDAFSKSQAIEDFICELKTQFLYVLKKEIFSKLDEMNIILPNTVLYKCKNFADIIKVNAKLISVGGRQCDLFYSEDERTYFQPQNLTFNNKKDMFNITNIFADESNFIAEKHGLANAHYVEEILCHHFTLYYLLGAIMPEYDNRISKINENLNLLLTNRRKGFGSLIGFKKETLKQLLLFDRLLGELTEIGEDGLLIYIMYSEFENCKYKKLSSLLTTTFKQLFQIALKHLKRAYNGILKIHDFFDKQLKTVESYANNKTVKIGLWIAFVSLLVALVSLIATNDIIMSWIKDLFN